MGWTKDMTIVVPQCLSCRHYVQDINSRNICTAFPSGLPPEIFTGDHDHLEPYPGDNGIRFEPITDEPDTDEP
jgi:hypothetical protein